MEYDVFISHSSKDKTIADAICHALEENDIRCWIAPRDIRPGKTWASEIGQGIKNSQIVLLVYTKNANQSEAVSNEIDIAFSNKKTIIPFLIDNTPMNEDFNFYLNRKHWLVAYPDYKKKFAELINSVCHILNKNKNGNIVVAPQKTSLSIWAKIGVALVIVAAISVVSFFAFQSKTTIENSPKTEIVGDSVKENGATNDTVKTVIDTIKPTPKIPIDNGKPKETKTSEPKQKTVASEQKKENQKSPSEPPMSQKTDKIIDGHSYLGFVNEMGQPHGEGTMSYMFPCVVKLPNSIKKEITVEIGDKIISRNWENGVPLRGEFKSKKGESFKW